MQELMNKLEAFLELGGTKKDITFLVISGIALILSLNLPAICLSFRNIILSFQKILNNVLHFI